MQVLQAILEICLAACGVWLTVMLIYQLYLTVFGFKRDTKDYQDHAPE